MILYRPVGLKELNLIKETEFKAFPPRLEGQPIFYPVLNEEYAREIGENWNTLDRFSGYSGFITRFELNDNYAKKFEIKVVGDSHHQEFWVPAEELEEFNGNIIGPIEVISAFYGDLFEGEKPEIKFSPQKDL